MMEQRTEENLSPYRTFSRAEWAMLREDTPMTLTSEEVTRLRSLHDRLDMAEVEEIYLPLSRLLSMYVAATQRLFRAEQRFLGNRRCENALHHRGGGFSCSRQVNDRSRSASPARALAERAEGRSDND
jgi:pantothenate kinase